MFRLGESGPASPTLPPSKYFKVRQPIVERFPFSNDLPFYCYFPSSTFPPPCDPVSPPWHSVFTSPAPAPLPFPLGGGGSKGRGCRPAQPPVIGETLEEEDVLRCLPFPVVILFFFFSPLKEGGWNILPFPACESSLLATLCWTRGVLPV